MANERRLSVLVTGDARGAVNALRETETSTQRAGETMQRAGTAMFAAGGVMVAGMFAAGRAASDLSETVNQSTVIFGDAADEIADYASTADQSLGQSERAASEAANGFGLFFTNAGLSTDAAADMSMTFTTLASDMASFKNTSPEEAVEALGAALRGESEPIRQYGVMLDEMTLRQRAMNMGLVESTSEVLPPQIRMQAAYQEVLAQTTTLQGDFANTAGGAANQERIMRAELENAMASVGTVAIPMMTRLFSTVSDAASGFADFNEESGGVAGKIAMGTGGLLLFVGAATTVIGKLITMKETLERAHSAMRSDKVQNYSAAFAGLTAVLTAATLAVRDHQQRQADAESMTVEFRDALMSAEGAANAMRESLTGIIEETDPLRQAMSDSGVTVDELNSALMTGEGWDSVRERLVAASDNFRVMNEILDMTAERFENARGESQELAVALAGAERAMGSVIPKTGELADGLGDVGDESDETSERVDNLRGSLNVFMGAINADQILPAFIGTLQGVRAQIDETDTSLSIFTEGGRANAAVMANLVEETFRYATEAGIAGESLETISANVGAAETVLNDLAAEFGWTTEQVAEYNYALNNLPTIVRTALELDVLASFERSFDPSRVGASGVPLQGHRAHGGPMLPGGTYIAGENGPEPITLGNMSAYAHAGGTGSAGATVNVVVQLDSQTIGEGLARNVRNGGTVLVGTR